MRGARPDVEADEALVEAVRGGDRRAFDELVDRHREWVIARCRRHLGGDRHAAEDVAQECFVALQRTLVSKDAPMRVRPWLSVVARNRCIDEARKLRAVPTPAVPDSAVFDPEVGTEDEHLARAWNALTGRHRAVLELRELGGLSYDEIAANLAVTAGAVEGLLFRARSALRREYARAGGKVASMAPIQESVARASGQKGVLSALVDEGARRVAGAPGAAMADAATGVGTAPVPDGTVRLLQELQARLLSVPGVDAAVGGPVGGGGRLRAALASASLLVGGVATVAGTVTTRPEASLSPPPSVVTVPDAGAATAPATAPMPPPAAPPTPPPAPPAPPTATPPAAVAPPPTPDAPPPTTPRTGSPPPAVVDVPAVVDGAVTTVRGLVEGTVGGLADGLPGRLTSRR